MPLLGVVGKTYRWHCSVCGKHSMVTFETMEIAERYGEIHAEFKCEGERDGDQSESGGEPDHGEVGSKGLQQ